MLKETDFKSYSFVQKEKIDELNGYGYVLEHKKTGARVLLIENDDDNKQQKSADARKVHADAEKTEDLPKNHEKGSETVNFDNQEKQARCRAQAAIWYEDEGFERIQAIRKTLESENRNRFSVNREGICSISIGKRKYRRVGILKGYPFGQTEVIREKLKKDGFITSMGCNNYLWISW